MKKLILMLFCIVFLTSAISALEFDNIKGYDLIEEKITIYNWNFIGKIFDIKLAEYVLTKNTDQCLINCYAEGSARLYTDGKLFSDLRFKGIDNKFKEIKSSNIFIEVTESYQEEVTDYKEVCSDKIQNGTLTNVCENKKSGSHNETKVKTYWKDYSFDILKPGDYKWRIEAKKKLGERIDWIGSAFGEDLTEWAWFDDDWNNCKNISIETSLTKNNAIMELNLTGLIFSNITEIRIVDAGCRIDGNETKSTVLQNGSDWGFTTFIANLSGSSLNYSVYYNNPTNPPQPDQLVDDFCEFNDDCGWTNTSGTVGDFIFDNGIFNITTDIGGIFSPIDVGQKSVLIRYFPVISSGASIGLTAGIANSTATTFAPAHGIGNHTSIVLIDYRAGFPRQEFIVSDATNSISENILASDTGLFSQFLVQYLDMNSTGDVNGTLYNSTDEINSIIGSLSATASDMSLWVTHPVSTNTDASVDYIRAFDLEAVFIPEFDLPSFTLGPQEFVSDVITTLISPVNDFNSTSSNINFSVDSTPNVGNLTNVTLQIFFSNGTLLLTNFTSLSGNISVITNFTIVGIPEGDFIWNALTKGTGNASNLDTNRTFRIDSTSPVIILSSPTGDQGGFVSGENLTLSWNVTDANLETCFFDYAGTNTTVTCSDNSTNFTVTNQSLNSLVFFANDTLGNSNSNSTNWFFSFVEDAIQFNSTTVETAAETFILQITTNGSIPSDGKFLYNNNQLGTITITNPSTNIFNLTTSSIDIPIGNVSNNFTYNFTISGGEVSSIIRTQNVSLLQFAFCNSTLTNDFINITFKNETIAEEDVSATISSTSIFWLGGGSVNKTLIFSNATENPSYAFCADPADRSLNVEIDIAYNNDESQQRNFLSISVLTNITTNQVLFLLPTILGLFSPFQTIDAIGNPIDLVDAVITRTLGGSTITATTGTTDSSGFVTFFLNPDITYTGTFTKVGLTDNIFQFVPSTILRLVRMGVVGQAVGGSNISINTTYIITPLNNSLNNNTDVNFGFNVSSSEAITFISQNITNSSGTQLLFNSTAGIGVLNGIVNTGNLSQIIGTYIVQTGTETLTLTKIWIVGEEFVGDYSLNNQLTLFLGYGFSDFMRLLIVILVIVGTLVFMTAGEITDTSESKIAAVVLLVWTFSFVGWLDNPSVVQNTGIAQFARQYGIAILTTFGGAFFILRRIFIRRI